VRNIAKQSKGVRFC